MKKNYLVILLLILICVPAFLRMLRPGIYSMHDFHVFRQFEFDRCIKDFQIPCRWSPDSTFEYGQPLFNYYGQLVYVPGEIIRLLGFQIIDAVKFTFILSIVGSAVAMYFVANKLWKDKYAALVSAALYVYAPYRAVDVWVRGALPEAFSFVYYPLIVLFFIRFVTKEKFTDLLLFSLTLSALLLTHNLSYLMFSLFFIPWVIYYLTIKKKWKLIGKLVVGVLLTVGLSAFYFLPVVFESNLVSTGGILSDIYNYKLHFTTLNQLLVSRFWGYGASVWGTGDGLSFSVGHFQWILSVLLFVLAGIYRKKFKVYRITIVLIVLGWFFVFLTHGKSEFIWELAKPMQFIQFPWRFISISVFLFALVGGSVIVLMKKNKRKILAFLIIFLAVATAFSFF